MNSAQNLVKLVQSLLVIVLGLLLLPTHAAASVLFNDPFNGSNTTLSEYNVNYTTWGVGEVFVTSDHAYSGSGTGVSSVYTGVSQENNCAFFDFRSDGWIGVLLRTTYDPSSGSFGQMDRLDILDGHTWRHLHKSVDDEYEDQIASGPMGSLQFDRFDPQVRTLKACANGTTLTAYLDGTPFWTGQTDNVGGYSGFGLYTPTEFIDNFTIIDDIPEVAAAPTIGIITVNPNPVTVNTAVAASVSFTDANSADTHTALWNWGDGTTTTCPTNTSSCTLTESNGSGSVSATHTYAATGIYEISLTVTDQSGAQSTKTYGFIAVYDASAGWASGSKAFISPAGAVSGNLIATGKADFGFQVKYSNGAIVPSGKNAELSFPAGNIDFISTGYLWLSVNGSSAIFAATGTLNGTPGYTLLASTIDEGNGNPSGLVRFKITRDSDNSVIYDTQPGTANNATPSVSVSEGKIKVQ